MSNRERWIWIRNWGQFQHYRDRRPPWIKMYTELMDDDAYLHLSEHRALLLHRLWLEFASSRSRLLLDTRSLSSRCFMRVTMADVKALSDAGFLELIASRTLAQRLQDARDPRAPPKIKSKRKTRDVDLGEKVSENGPAPSGIFTMPDMLKDVPA